MLIYDHLIGKTALGELQFMRMHNVGALSTNSTPTATGLLQYLTSNNSLNVHVGSDVWKRLIMSGDSLSVLAPSLTDQNIWLGNGSNLPVETLISTIALNRFGAATADISMGGFKITTLADPTADSDAANKKYVDNIAQGLTVKDSCLLGSNGALPACVYSTSNLTLTASANGALTATAIDSSAGAVTLAAGDRYLIMNQAVSEQNGIYTPVTTADLGSGVTPWKLTRTSDTNANSELLAAFTLVERGTFLSKGYSQTSVDYDIFNPTTKFITWTLFSSAGSYSAGQGLMLTAGNTFTFARSASYVNGDLFYGKVTGGTGDEIITKLGVLALETSGKILQAGASAPQWTSYQMPTGAPTNQSLLISNGTNITALGSTTSTASLLMTDTADPGNVGWSANIPTAVTIGGAYIYRGGGTDVSMNDGGTGASITGLPGGLIYASTASAMACQTAGASGTFARSGGTGAPTWYDLLNSANIWTAENTYNSSTTTASLIAIKVTTDTQDRIQFLADGTIAFGSGSVAPTTAKLSFAGTGVLKLDGDLDIKRASMDSALHLYNAAGTYNVGLQAPVTLAASLAWLVPPTAVLNGYWKVTNLAGAVATLSCSTIPATDVTGVALTKTDDTNVTLTLGGNPSSCLINTASITAGWNGLLAVGRGGTGQTTLTANAILAGNTTTAILQITPGLNTVLASTATGGPSAFSGQPTLATGIITKGQGAVQIEPHNTATGNTGEIRFLELAAGGSQYVGFKAPDAITTSKIWVLPNADGTANHFLKTDGSGNLAFAQPTAAQIGGGVALTTGTADANVIITLGGTPGTALLTAASITMSWASFLSVTRGGTGQSSALFQYGVIHATTTAAMGCTAAAAAAGRHLLGSNAAVPSWSSWALPGSMAANSLIVGATTTTTTALATANNCVLATDSSGIVSWGGLLNVPRNTPGGIARKFCKLIQGDGTTATISVAHGLNTRDVVVSVRTSNATDINAQEIGIGKITVEDATTVKIYFNQIQTAATYYIITVVG